jgi:hypothetical protein
MIDREPYKRNERCVRCGRQHLPGVAFTCDVAQTMNLPAGKTCGDCLHIGRCKALFGHIEADEQCDWFPVRFLARPEVAA